jgi:hypothetical protein
VSNILTAMNSLDSFLIGRWRLKSWLSRNIIHSAEEDRRVLHSPDGIPEEECTITEFKVWDADRSAVYKHAFLQSFRSDSEMAVYDIYFIDDTSLAPWKTLEIWNADSNVVVKSGAWQIDRGSMDLSVWDYNINLKIKILSDTSILLKELYEQDEMESDTHEIVLERYQ